MIITNYVNILQLLQTKEQWVIAWISGLQLQKSIISITIVMNNANTCYNIFWEITYDENILDLSKNRCRILWETPDVFKWYNIWYHTLKYIAQSVEQYWNKQNTSWPQSKVILQLKIKHLYCKVITMQSFIPMAEYQFITECA